MLSIASDLGVPIHNDARDRDLRLPAVSRVRLPMPSMAAPSKRKHPQEATLCRATSWGCMFLHSLSGQAYTPCKQRS